MDRVVFGSSKTYTHSVGLSCCFRQWRAKSHCNQFHGYVLQVEIEFEASHLDDNNWVVDFGNLKEVKQWLENTFDHKMLVARDDPEVNFIQELDNRKLASIVWMDKVGCEAFSLYIWNYLDKWLLDADYYPRVKLKEVRVREHEGNSGFVRMEQY